MDAALEKAKNTTSPSESGHDLPPDLFPEILSRLPVKSLLRFRCVSKPWLALVDDDADFARLHLNNYKNNCDETRLFVVQTGITNSRLVPECFVRRSDTFEPVSEMQFPLSFAYRRVVSSLHGLILLKYVSTTFGQCRGLKVWNPSIRKLQEIPPLLEQEVGIYPSSLCVEIDIGLGYDSVAKSYKLVKLICLNNTLHSVAIYTLGDDSWRIIKLRDKGSQLCSNWHCNVDYIDRAVHFRSSFFFVSRDVNKKEVWDLVRFDLSKEVFSSDRMPAIHPRDLNWWKLVSIVGESSLVALDRSFDLYSCALDSESMSWTKLQLGALKLHDLLHVKKNGDMLMFGMRRSDTFNNQIDKESREDSGKVTLINHETGECTTLPQRFDSHSLIIHASCYVESLILHK